MDAFKKQQPKKTLFKRIILPIIITLLIAGILVGLFFLLRPVYYRQLEKNGIEDTEQAAEIALKLKNAGMQNSAITVLEHGAESGNGECQFLLAKYYDGKEPFYSQYAYKRNNIKAAYWFLQSAKSGYADAYVEIALKYKFADGVDLDLNNCIKWLQAGEEGNNASALYELGNCYATGLFKYKFRNPSGNYGYVYFVGLHNDLKKDGRSWVNNVPHYIGQQSLNKEWRDVSMDEYDGVTSIETTYLQKDLNKAKEYWKKAAEQGHEGAKSCIQKIYNGDE